VIEVRLIPDGIEALSDQGEGLWGSAPDERIERGIARLQSMLGPEGVLAVGLQGGRGPAARQSTTPWGEQPVGRRPAELPWPGSIPPPAPTRVFAERRPAMVYGPAGRPITLTDRGLITAEPTTFTTDTDNDPTRRIQSWAGPWPIEELWWDPAKARRIARFQVVGVDGSAWLLVLENGRWFAEARYE
jgi:protein ImuB